MTRLLIAGVAVGAAALIAAGATPAGADGHGHHAQRTVVYTLDDSSHGNPEGVTSDGKYFYVGATGDGTIYRGRVGDRTVHTFIPGAPGRAAVGMKAVNDHLYVAGGPTGIVFVYDLRHPGRAPLTFDTGAGGFLNDLVVTGRGDVYVTDSFRPTLWVIPAGQVRPGGHVTAVSVAPEIPYVAGAFNLNGIVSAGDHAVIAIDTSNGVLYRISVKGMSRTITPVDAPALVGGDGMLVDKGRLIVVRGNPASLTFLKLRGDGQRATIDAVVTDPALRGPSTVARAEDSYLVVNADFATSTQPFTVVGLPRDAD